MNFGIVGAGFTGAVVANELSKRGHKVTVFDKRGHVAGNCHTVRHQTGAMVHAFGPHVFHTPHDHVWEYISRFSEMVPFTLRAKTTVGSSVYSLPINLHTINQFFRKKFSPTEAEKFIKSKTVGSPETAVSFRDMALATVGEELYDAFFRGYTAKQWQVDPAELPASVFSRLPLRFNYNDSYFNHKWQGIPRNGYTAIVEKMLDAKGIDVVVGTSVSSKIADDFDHVVWSGAIDEYFDYEFGELGYRTLDFEEIVADGDYQGCAMMNYGDETVTFTRITEHKHFTPWESHERTVAFREYSRKCEAGDTPYYPIRLVAEKKQLSQYVEAASRLKNTTFAGRLGTYRYIDMDVTIAEALKTSIDIINAIENNAQISVFCVKVD